MSYKNRSMACAPKACLTTGEPMSGRQYGNASRYSRKFISSNAKRSISAAQPYSSLNDRLPTETPLRTNHGVTITSQPSAKAAHCTTTLLPGFDNRDRPWKAMSAGTTGARTTKEARVRQSRPNKHPASRRWRVRGPCSTSTPPAGDGAFAALAARAPARALRRCKKKNVTRHTVSVQPSVWPLRSSVETIAKDIAGESQPPERRCFSL